MTSENLRNLHRTSSTENLPGSRLSYYNPADCEDRLQVSPQVDKVLRLRNPTREQVPEPPDSNSSILAKLTQMSEQLSLLTTQVGRLLECQGGLQLSRLAYTVEEVAKLRGLSSYTVREHCRQGRIIATKREEHRGGAAVWSISAGELHRIQNHGLLQPDSMRNAS
jgi:hypothetical protein